jgi:hypothetical protein
MYEAAGSGSDYDMFLKPLIDPPGCWVSIMGSYLAQFPASNIRDNVKTSSIGPHLEKPVFCSQSGFDMVLLS